MTDDVPEERSQTQRRDREALSEADTAAAEPAGNGQVPGDRDRSRELSDTAQPETAIKDAEAALMKADVITEQSGPEMRVLLAKAYIEDGIPARIVHTGEGAASLPDLTADESGQRVLRRLDAYIDGCLEQKARTAASNQPKAQ